VPKTRGKRTFQALRSARRTKRSTKRLDRPRSAVDHRGIARPSRVHQGGNRGNRAVCQRVGSSCDSPGWSRSNAYATVRLAAKPARFFQNGVGGVEAPADAHGYAAPVFLCLWQISTNAVRPSVEGANRCRNSFCTPHSKSANTVLLPIRRTDTLVCTSSMDQQRTTPINGYVGMSDSDERHPGLDYDYDRKMLVGAESLAWCFECDASTIRRWASNGTMPKPLKVGGRRLWDAEGIREWIRQGCPRCDDNY